MLIGVEKGRKPKRCSLLPPKLKLRGKLVGGKETRGDVERDLKADGGRVGLLCY